MLRAFPHLVAILALASALSPARAQGQSRTPPAPTPPATITLDTHYHFSDQVYYDDIGEPTTETDPDQKSESTILRNLDAGGVETAFLLSDAYTLPAPTKGATVDRRREMHRELSELTYANERLVGFCSVALAWPDRTQVLRECLSLPGMRGVKVHLRTGLETLTDPLVRSRFHEILRAAQPFGVTVLAHFYFDHARALDEASEIFDASRAFPEINLIIAHAAERHPEVLVRIGELIREEPTLLRRNLYAEISTTMGNSGMFYPDSARTMAAWRAFGIDWILFGSDSPAVGSCARTASLLEASPLTEAEKYKIAVTNGQRVLDQVRQIKRRSF